MTAVATVTPADVLRRNNVVVTGNPDGPVLLFAHGFGCDQNMWRRVLPAFTDHYKVVVFDHVGAGCSDLSAYVPAKYATLQGYADDVLDICEALDVRDVTVVAHSISAMIAVHAAVTDPGRLARLVLVGPSPSYITEGDYPGGFSREDIDGLLESLDSNYFAWAAMMAPTIMGNPDEPELGEELEGSFCRTDPTIARAFAKVTFLSDSRDLLGAGHHPRPDPAVHRRRPGRARGRSLRPRADAGQLLPPAPGERPLPARERARGDVGGDPAVPGRAATVTAEAVEALQEAAERVLQPGMPEAAELETLYHEAPCGYLTITDGGSIVRVNDAFLRWSGHSREKLVGTTLQQLLPIGDRILLSTHTMPQLQLSGVLEESAVDILTADGSRRPALMTARRTRGVDGLPALTRLIVFSARERRKYEQELLTALRRAEESEAERRLAQDELRHRASHDQLTGLPNRAGLAQLLSAALLEADESGRLLGVLVVDMDNFKTVNDSLGHGAGDQLLRVVARRLAALSPTATVARLSGDEFAVVEQVGALTGGCEGAVPTATALAERLLEELALPVTLEGLEVVAGASIGIAITGGQTVGSHEDAEQVLRRADIAMYRAKARGRACWEVHDPAQVDPEVERLHLMGELRRGIRGGELRVHYQPRIDLATGACNGAEALVRWQHPTRGLLPPGQFIDVAEQTGLIIELGAHVLDAALAQAAEWAARRPHAPVEVAVNLSARQLSDPTLVSVVSRSLARHGLDPHLLTLEITETALMADAAAALDMLNALKELGVRLSIDDFGTGYSSFTYLKSFPMDELKIDKSFVDGIGDHAQDAAIIASCLSLARAVGLTTVAEGVETPEQHQALVDLGCDYAQGYLLGRPVPPEHFEL